MKEVLLHKIVQNRFGRNPETALHLEVTDVVGQDALQVVDLKKGIIRVHDIDSENHTLLSGPLKLLSPHFRREVVGLWRLWCPVLRSTIRRRKRRRTLERLGSESPARGVDGGETRGRGRVPHRLSLIAPRIRRPIVEKMGISQVVDTLGPRLPGGALVLVVLRAAGIVERPIAVRVVFSRLPAALAV